MRSVVTRLAVALALVAGLGSVAQAGGATYGVRVLFLDLETRVGTITTDLEFEVVEHSESGYPSEQAAHDRADAILEHGFRFEHDPGHGRVQHVPARRVERVEVYTVPTR
jgi:hypothetical protein